jgi:hypothetical protein
MLNNIIENNFGEVGSVSSAASGIFRTHSQLSTDVAIKNDNKSLSYDAK